IKIGSAPCEKNHKQPNYQLHEILFLSFHGHFTVLFSHGLDLQSALSPKSGKSQFIPRYRPLEGG
ncbi:hypothetical protein L6232_24085, partial [Shewanella sp. C31]|nr:hypothetical protein [Shewanella electrica]